MNNKLLKQCLSITHNDSHTQMAIRAYWQHHHLTRQSFINELNKEGLKGKDYSDAVVEWDKTNRAALIDKINNV